MIPSLRRKFNDEFTEEKHARFVALLSERTGAPPQFQHNETPCFFEAALIEKMERYGKEMLETLLADDDYRKVSDAAIPPEFKVQREDSVPLFIQVDFGLDENHEPKLVEMQGFPSLYAYQPVVAECYREAYAIDLPYLPGGLSLDDYNALLRRAIVADHDRQNVILMEIDPWHQKTSADFRLTEKICGIKTVDIAHITREGRRLFHDGVPIHRIYNRAIVDELQRRQIALQFDFRDDLDVEWAGHPNWFFRLSKFSLPYIKHPAVPETRFLDDLDRVADPERVVLKPLFSFAGLGVVVGPSAEQIEAARGHGYIVQDRVDFTPVIETPHGPDKVEIRVMYLWLDTLRAVNTVVRTGRGSQMGVDHNKNMNWVGASAAFLSPSSYPPPDR
ncbi:MAG: hypothetical protein ABJF23_20385 [Bryobacteraceae bacterium]